MKVSSNKRLVFMLFREFLEKSKGSLFVLAIKKVATEVTTLLTNEIGGVTSPKQNSYNSNSLNYNYISIQ